MAEHRIWFDCDTGVDDAIALLTAHRQPGLEIVGLSTVAGNVTLGHTTENTLKICGLMGADYPVYSGAPGPLRREREDASSFHGADGLGGAVLPAPRRAPEQTPAWDALYEAAARMPGELTLVATGPLTNAAIALTAHPALRSLLRSIALMGGAAVGGNRTPCSEFNIHADPDAAEIVFSSGIPIIMCGLDVTEQAWFSPAEFAALPPAQMQPMLLWKDGAPTDFTYRDIQQYGGYLRAEPCESFSALLDRFYTETDHAERMRQRSQTLRKAISNLHERTRRKLELQRQELEATHDREQLRRQGDIVTANLHAITRGQTLLRAEDFYDEDLREIEIPLKPNLSPQQNAARFYKDYARAKHAEQVLTQQIAQGEIEEAYLGGVLEELARVENERDLSEIRAELEAGGYVRPADRRKQVKQQPSKPMHFRSSDGFDIFVGRNNRQNDQLSLKTARRDDLWLHVQKFHGTHVIIACAGIQPPDETITEAAELAAYYSEARESQNVPVDVTPVRFLRKPNGAKPGMVVYDRYRTVLVTPDAALPARLRVE